MIAVELRKLARRPRTWVAIGLLNLLPTIVAILLAVTKIGPRPGEGPAFLSAVLSQGALFSVAALAIVLPLFLPVAVAVISGDSITGEAQSGMLRYLLARPVGRTRLLIAKLVAVFVFVIVAVVLVAGVGYVVGSLLLGNEPVTATTSISSVSGTTLTPGQIAVRTVLSIAYVALSMIGVAAMALFLSTLIGSSLLLTLDAARALQAYLPTRYWLSFVDLFRDPIQWYNIERGVGIQVVYVVVLLGAAWANFMTKDVTS